MDRVYLDHNATTPVEAEVFEAMRPYFQTLFGNASSTHLEGQQARQAVECAREQVARFLGVEPRSIVFTSGGTEADNLAILGLAHHYRDRGRHVLISAVEHPAVRESAHALAEQGFQVEEIPVTPQGILDLDRFSALLQPDTVLVAVMAANNETGVLQPVEVVGRMCADRGILFHVDAVQAAGKVPVDPIRWQCTTLALSAHKIYGPKGVGALYIQPGVELQPLMFGGTHERGRRPGTENVAAIVGLGAACERAQQVMMQEAERLARLRDRLQQALQERFPELVVHGADAPRVPNTLMVSFPGLDGETLVMRLDLEGFAVSTGSACASGRIEPSHVLRAMGVDAVVARGALRISLGRVNTWEQLERFVATLERVVPQLARVDE